MKEIFHNVKDKLGRLKKTKDLFFMIEEKHGEDYLLFITREIDNYLKENYSTSEMIDWDKLDTLLRFTLVNNKLIFASDPSAYRKLLVSSLKKESLFSTLRSIKYEEAVYLSKKNISRDLK